MYAVVYIEFTNRFIVLSEQEVKINGYMNDMISNYMPLNDANKLANELRLNN